MSNPDRRDPNAGPVVGIFSLFFREAGTFWNQAYEQVECAVKDFQNDARSREDRRRMEAQARLLEEMRRAKEAGLDPEAVLRSFQVASGNTTKS